MMTVGRNTIKVHYDILFQNKIKPFEAAKKSRTNHAISEQPEVFG